MFCLCVDRECDQSGNDVVDRFAREVVLSLPPNSLVLTRGDLPGNTLRYLHYCQGLRPDLSLVDQEVRNPAWHMSNLFQPISDTLLCHCFEWLLKTGVLWCRWWRIAGMWQNSRSIYLESRFLGAGGIQSTPWKRKHSALSSFSSTICSKIHTQIHMPSLYMLHLKW